jgi:hypothetical protein
VPIAEREHAVAVSTKVAIIRPFAAVDATREARGPCLPRLDLDLLQHSLLSFDSLLSLVLFDKVAFVVKHVIDGGVPNFVIDGLLVEILLSDIRVAERAIDLASRALVADESTLPI